MIEKIYDTGFNGDAEAQAILTIARRGRRFEQYGGLSQRTFDQPSNSQRNYITDFVTPSGLHFIVLEQVPGVWHHLFVSGPSSEMEAIKATLKGKVCVGDGCYSTPKERIFDGGRKRAIAFPYVDESVDCMAIAAELGGIPYGNWGGHGFEEGASNHPWTRLDYLDGSLLLSIVEYTIKGCDFRTTQQWIRFAGPEREVKALVREVNRRTGITPEELRRIDIAA